ncbi:MAG: STAS domain-containing protein [Thermodesulfobacteriota bacterium]
MSLEIRTTQKALNAYVVSCSGRLDTETAPSLEKEVRRLVGLGPQVLALDLEQLTYMSSAGVRVLMIAHKGMKDLSGKVVLLRLQPQIKKVLEIIQALPEQRIFKGMDELDAYLDSMQRKVLEGD